MWSKGSWFYSSTYSELLWLHKLRARAWLSVIGCWTAMRFVLSATRLRKGKVLTGRSLIGEEWEAFEEAVVAATYGCKADSHNIKGSRTGRTNKN